MELSSIEIVCRPEVKENSKQYVQFFEQIFDRKQSLGAPEVSLVEENLLL